MTCSFSNATTAWNYVQADGATGKCKDVGAAFPTGGGQVVGQVLETGAAGNREIRFGSEPQPGGGSSTTAVYAGHYYPFGDYTAAAATSAATTGRVYYFRFTPPLDVPVSTLIPVLLAGSSSTYVAMAFMDGNCNKVAGSDVRVTGLTTSLYYYPTHPATDPLTLAAGNEYYFAVVGDGARETNTTLPWSATEPTPTSPTRRVRCPLLRRELRTIPISTAAPQLPEAERRWRFPRPAAPRHGSTTT